MNTTRVVTIQAADCAFQAEQCGVVPSSIFLHGFGGDLQTWDGVWSALCESLPMLRYDLRGFGRTADRAQKPFSHTNDLLAILDVMAAPQIDLVGLSMGGAIALNFALHHPDRVRKLILISPGIVGWEWSKVWVDQWRAVTTKARAGAMEEARELWWQHPLFATVRASKSALDFHASIRRYSGQQWLHDGQLPALPDIERLHTLRAPTLLLTGGRDLDDFQLIASVIESSVPHLQRVVFAEHGHMLPLEIPAACAEQIEAFFASEAHA